MTLPNQEANPRFTVIIPTKDRAPYLFHTLRSCSMQEYENLEIVVSDDASTDETRSVVEEASRRDPRIRYTSPAGSGMLDNFEHALDQVKPGYVIALGGDDGLLPHGVTDMRETLRETGKAMLCWPAPAYFYAKTRSPTSQVILRVVRGRPYTGRRIVSSRSYLERQARELSYVSDVESPMFYVKGVVSTTLVDAVRSRSGGRFYSCSTPDGYSGIALAGEVDEYAFSGRPFSLHGVSPTSAGVTYWSESDKAKKISEAFFKSATNRPMHAELGSQPYSPLISLMTADFLLTARDLPGWRGVTPSIDFRSLLVKGLSELVDGQFAKDRVARELSILHGIAKHHGLSQYFRDRVRNTRRNMRRTLEGDAISSTRLYFDGDKLGINNVVDAAYFAHYAHAMSARVSASMLADLVANSVTYRMLSFKKGLPFPPESEWIEPAP